MLDKEKIADATNRLDEIVIKSTFDESTQNALIYFTGNKDKLKYLLTAYKISDRYNILVDHLKNQFGDKINIHMLRPHIIKHGIWDIPRLTFINWAVPIILSLIIFCSLLYIVGLHFFSLLLSIIATFVLFVIIGALVECVNDSNVVFYRNSKEYRSLPKPKKML